MRLTLSICLLVVAACGMAVAESVKSLPAPADYVSDFAGVLNESTKADLNALGRAVDTQAHAQIFVVTIHKIDDDEPVEQFANELFARWKIGPAKSDRGVLILLSIEDRKRWIEVGYGLEGILPDARVGDIGRDAVPDLQSGNYDGAVRAEFNAVADTVAKDAGVTLQTTSRYQRRSTSRSSGRSGIFGFIVLAIVVIVLLRSGGGGPGGFLAGMLLGNVLGGGRSYGGGYGGGGGFGGGEGGSSGGGGAGGGW